MQRKGKRNKLIIVGILLLLIGVVFGATSFLCNYHNKQVEDRKVDEFIENSSIENNDTNDLVITEEESKVEVTPVQYSMVIEIPKMNLKKGLYDINSKYNNVDYNIQIIKESDMPNKENGNLILAGHNGNSNISYFDNLNTLSNGDSVFIFYEGKKYTYKIFDNYEVKKIGKVFIHGYSKKTTITLISCKKNTKDKQIVYIGEQVNSVVY